MVALFYSAQLLCVWCNACAGIKSVCECVVFWREKIASRHSHNNFLLYLKKKLQYNIKIISILYISDSFICIVHCSELQTRDRVSNRDKNVTSTKISLFCETSTICITIFFYENKYFCLPWLFMYIIAASLLLTLPISNNISFNAVVILIMDGLYMHANVRVCHFIGEY